MGLKGQIDRFEREVGGQCIIIYAEIICLKIWIRRKTLDREFNMEAAKVNCYWWGDGADKLRSFVVAPPGKKRTFFQD